MKLLIIRPQPGADATAARVRNAGYKALLMPLFEIRALDWEVPDPAAYDALLLTSGNAVRMAGLGLHTLRALPVHAVGAATAGAAERAGLDIASQGSADAAAILQEALRAGHGRLLWLCGEDRSELPEIDGLTVDAVPVYASTALSAPQDFAEQVAASDVVLLHSARAAHHFTVLCDAHGLARANIRLAAFSQNIAAAAGDGWRSLLVSTEPSDAALLSLLTNAHRNGAL